MLRQMFVLSLLVAPVPGLSQGWIVPRPCAVPMPRDDRPMPMPMCRPFPVSSVVRTRSDVRAELANGVLRYEVEERFVNRGGGLGEADYVFPLPKGAAFQDLKLSINGELVSGETMNAGEARRIYEEIVRRQRDPALVEWMGYGLLRARIFPINPGEEKRVVVRFQTVAEREGDALRVDYLPGKGTQNDAAGSFTLTYAPNASLGTPYSPTHGLDVSDADGRRRIEVRQGGGDQRALTVLIPLRRPSEAAISALAYAPGGEDAFALITLAPPLPTTRAPTPRDITFVLDVSGSMAGKKIEQARAAGRQILETLRRDDRFRLIDFSTDVRTFRDDFVAATEENVRAARRYLDALDAEGSTNISGALAEALRPRPDDGRLSLVLFVTDGEPTVGERNPAQIAAIAARDRGARRIFTFGLGSDVNASLLEQLAMEGRGTAQFVRPDESVERMVGVVASRLVDPVLTDVRVHVDGDVRLAKLLPAGPLDLFAGQDLVLLARYSGHGSSRVTFEGRPAGRGSVVRWASTVDFPERQRDNSFVARLWATQRIGYLSAEKRKGGASGEMDDEIRSLGERFGIPTEFTSYLVQEPGMVAHGRMAPMSGVGGVPRPEMAPPQAVDAFSSAKTAAGQRAVTSIAVADSIGVADRSRLGNNAQVRQVGGRSFVLREGRWIDARYRDGVQLVKIKAYSAAYFDLLNELPELRPVFALGDRVVVMGKTVAVEVDGTAPAPSAEELRRVVRGW